ncbi:MAG: hypothetical protein SFV15_02080 [Polyangiaceae bacterium]|nr:hypothetical protein [Polyangiaceae bacterium]
MSYDKPPPWLSPNAVSRRTLLGAAFGALASDIFSPPRNASAAAGSALVVFVHIDSKLRLLQTALEKQLPGTSVRTFSRFGDVRGAMASADAVLALAPVVASLGVSVAKSGVRSGKVTEPYSLVSTDASVKPSNVSKVGFVDILGRRETTSFVQKIVGGSAQVERVTKLQDLLPLLQLKMAQAILVPTRLVPAFREQTRMQLHDTPAPNEIPLPVVGASSAAGRRIADKLQGANASLNNLLGVQSWR